MDTIDMILVGLMALLVIVLGGLFGALFLGFRRPSQ